MKNVLLFILTFILSGLLVAGTIWGLGKAGKITYIQEIKPEWETIDAKELIRQLIPDEGEKAGRWEIRTKLGNRIKWDSLSMNTNTWKGKCILSFNHLPDKVFEGVDSTTIPYYKSPRKLREKLLPCEWKVSITGEGSEYFGFSLFSDDDCYPFDNDILKELLYLIIDSWESKNGDYVEKKGDKIRVQCKGKVPTWFHTSYNRTGEFVLHGRFKS